MLLNKKSLSILMAVLMVFAMMPMSAGFAYAEDETPATQINVSFDANGGTGAMDPVSGSANSNGQVQQA